MAKLLQVAQLGHKILRKKVKKSFSDFVARVFQHENDHLDGIVFLDRLETTKDIITDKEYQKIIATK